MLSVVRHVARSSLSLRTATRRPTTLNMRPTGLGPDMFAVRTLISEFQSLGRLLDESIYATPLNVFYATPAKKYTEDHEAVIFDDSTGIGIVSVTDYAQNSLGDVVFVELPALETKVAKGGQEFPRSLCAFSGV